MLPDLAPLHLFVTLPLATLALAVSGWLVALALLPRLPHATATEADLRTVLLALGWGFGLTPTWAFFVHALSGPPVTPAWLLALAALQGWLAVEVLLRSGRVARFGPELLDLPRLRAVFRNHGALLAGALAVGLLYFLKHESSVSPSSCIGEAAICAVGHGSPGQDVLRDNIGDARLGNSGVLSGFLALYGDAGFRVLYALVGVLLALGGALLGQRTGGAKQRTGDSLQRAGTARVWAWAGLLFLPLNPYVASIPLLDENLLTLAWSVVLLPLLFGPPRGQSHGDGAPIQAVPWTAVGALFGLVVAMRHPMLVCLPALLLLAWTDAVPVRLRLQRVGRLLLGVTLLTAVENLHHLLALGSLLRFEHNTQYPPLPYSLFGVPFVWEGMVNWPLHDTLIRTPHNPFPTFALWPLWLADHLGLLLTATLPLGVWALWQRAPREAAFWLLWWLPVHAGLSLQEAWDYPNKMGILVIVFAPFLVWSLHGLRLVVSHPRQAVPALLVLA